jgi:chromosome partitioning protein
VEIRYRRQHFAKILGLSDRHLAEADNRSDLASLEGAPDDYGPTHLSAYRRALGRHPSKLPLRRQLFLNFKGGTGKTSLSVSYAYRLAEMGYRVLLVDLDSQGMPPSTWASRGSSSSTPSTTSWSIGCRSTKRSSTQLAEFDLLPANLGMSTVELALMPLAGREYRLKKALDDVADRYDFIVMDAPPSFGLLNLNALIAADDLFVPVLPDFLSFHGLKLLFETLSGLEDDLDHTCSESSSFSTSTTRRPGSLGRPEVRSRRTTRSSSSRRSFASAPSSPRPPVKACPSAHSIPRAKARRT